MWSFGLVFLCGQLMAQQATVSGTVTEEGAGPMVGVTVYVEGTTNGTTTNMEGEFTLSVKPGKRTIIASSIGFGSSRQEVEMAAGDEVKLDFVLGYDPLGLDEVIVTGARNDKSKMESSVAITTLDAKTIDNSATRSATEVFSFIPGFYVESSGGEGNGNIFARGIPSAGGMRYVQLQEDGMPVFEYGDLMFGNTDIFIRNDLNLDRIESVRGGASSILVSNAPGGIINMISKTGRGEISGTVRQSLGLTYNLFRSDFEVGGSLNEDWHIHMGGFYRTDDGIRSPGFTSSNGGQFKANITRTFDKGYVRAYVKYLNDRSQAILPIPLQGDPAEGIPGFDPNFGSMASVDNLEFAGNTPNGDQVRQRLDRGMHPQVMTWGAESKFDLGQGWTLSNNFRHSTIDAQFNAIFSTGNPQSAEDYAASRGLTNFSYAYANGQNAGETLDMSNLNGNGLVANYGWWSVDIPLSQFANKFELDKDWEAANLKTTFGYYYNNNTVSAEWWWHDMLVDVSDNTRRLDLFNADNGEALTSNGYSQYGTIHRNYMGQTTINAPYFNAEWQPLTELTLDGGMRFDIGNTSGFTEETSEYDYDVNGDGFISEAEQGVQYGSKNYIPFDYDYNALSWSFGANYMLNSKNAVFVRVSEGNRAPNDRVFAFDATTATSDGVPENTEVETIFQAELGYKTRFKKVSLFATAFYSRFDNIRFTDFVTDPDGNIVSITDVYNTSALGLELEAVARFGNLDLFFTGTFQDVTYNDWIFNEEQGDGTLAEVNFDGNQIQRIPQMYFTFRPQYTIADKLEIGLVWQHFGRRFTNPENRQVLPAFNQINATLGYRVTDRFRIDISANNVTNELGLTEGNPRSGLTGVEGQYFYARPIFGRSAIASLTYAF